MSVRVGHAANANDEMSVGLLLLCLSYAFLFCLFVLWMYFYICFKGILTFSGRNFVKTLRLPYV